MRTMLSAISANTKYKIDLKLVPLALILVEFSIFATQFSSVERSKLLDLLFLRLVHTFVMLVIALIISKTYTKLKIFEFNYQTLAFYGISFIALGDVIHAFLANIIGIELIDVTRRIGILLFQGIFWFPVFMIVSGYREDILRSFHDYQQRLLVAARTRSRASREFKTSQIEIQDQTRLELLDTCRKLRDAIRDILDSKENLVQQNANIRPHLLGDDLRKLSMKLDTKQSQSIGRKVLGKDVNSIHLLVQQLRVLYASSVKKAPLRWRAYALVLVALVTPPYINFYTPAEALFSYPLLLLFIYVFSHLIAKVQASNSSIRIKISSFLILLTGFLPFFLDIFEGFIPHDHQMRFPLLVSAVALPITYYLFMEALQVFRPKALKLIRNDELEVSHALQSEITHLVSKEFAHNLSHQWAVYIHGKILTRLAATSLKLESAIEADDRKAFSETTDSLLALLNAPDSDFDEVSTDLETEIISRLDPWIGLLEINLVIAPDLKAVRNLRVRELGEVIEELISNSIRHGKAKKIDLSILSSGESDVQITAIDDSPFAPNDVDERSGLGTRIFNLASDGRWSITRNGASTIFTLTMAIRA